MLKLRISWKMSDANEKLITIADDIGFTAEELIACRNCGRSNAPNKPKCLYCGSALPVTDLNVVSALSALRQLEAWESGFNIILTADGGRTNLESASGLLSIDPEELRQIVELNTAMPLLRVEDEHIAGSMTDALAEFGFETHFIADKVLDAEHPPIRVRAIDIAGQNLVFTDFNSKRSYTVEIDDLVLIVAGRLYESRREEVTRRKRGAMKVLDEFETSGDVGVVDIYSRIDDVGFRIQTNGFDFSVLGDGKEMLAGKNLAKLVELLRSICVNCVFSEEYSSVRHFLDLVWVPEISKELHGLQMRGYGKREFGATYTSSNQAQFTKYSRMRRSII